MRVDLFTQSAESSANLFQNIPTDIPRKKVLLTVLRSLRSVKMTEKKTSTMIRELKFLGPATNLQEEMRGWRFG